MEHKKNRNSYVLVVGFLVMLALPGLNSALGIWTFNRVSENRTFTDSLSLNINHLDQFPEDAESYVNDNFSFRKPLLDLYHQLKYSVFNTSPHPDKLIIGSNGWCFRSDKELEDYQGKNNFTTEELDQFLAEWKRRTKYLEKRGIKVYWMIAPTAHGIYKEFLPFNVQAGSVSRIDQLKNHFKGELPNLIIDPRATLIANKSTGKIYCQQDNHWDFRAGHVANKSLIKRLRVDFPDKEIPIPHVSRWQNMIEYNGIHRKVLGVEKRGEVRQIPVFNPKNSVDVKNYGFPCVPGFPYPWEYEHRFKNPKIKKGCRAVIIRDSFGAQIMPFMSESFSESVFIFDSWKYQLNEPIVETVKPDVVIFLMVETHLESIIQQH